MSHFWVILAIFRRSYLQTLTGFLDICQARKVQKYRILCNVSTQNVCVMSFKIFFQKIEFSLKKIFSNQLINFLYFLQSHVFRKHWKYRIYITIATFTSVRLAFIKLQVSSSSQFQGPYHPHCYSQDVSAKLELLVCN